VLTYQQRYSRDPPPHFDKWHEYATARDSIVIDDFDNIEEDLAPFSALSPAELRQRTAEVLAHGQGMGGVRIRDGKLSIIGEVPGSHRWMLDGAIHMIEKFADFVPDMDLAFNLHDECRVAIPYSQLEVARSNGEHYREHTSDNGEYDFRPDRASTWQEPSEFARTPSYFENAALKPSFQTYGSMSCPTESRARKERRWDTGAFCSACAAPHSLGAFVANWTLSASLCHQPDLANLHGLNLSPATLLGTHALVPVFSQSRAPGYADIRYPSPWNYMDKAKYEFGESYPDPSFAKKDNVLFWRGATSEGFSKTGSWKGMLRQRFVHLLNNETSRQPIFLPTGSASGKSEYVMEKPATIKELLETKVDAGFIDEAAQTALTKRSNSASKTESTSSNTGTIATSSMPTVLASPAASSRSSNRTRSSSRRPCSANGTRAASRHGDTLFRSISGYTTSSRRSHSLAGTACRSAGNGQ
jgi:hypothetical protein